MYEELVSHLRECSKIDPVENTYKEAADAIEELQKANCELLFRVEQAEALIDYYQAGKAPSNKSPKEET